MLQGGVGISFTDCCNKFRAMINEENKGAAEQPSEASPDDSQGMDRNEGQTLNGPLGGTGSDLDNVSKRLEEEREGG